jgi:hypothetical protein
MIMRDRARMSSAFKGALLGTGAIASPSNFKERLDRGVWAAKVDAAALS